MSETTTPECSCTYGTEGGQFTRFPDRECLEHSPTPSAAATAADEPMDACEICTDGWEDCGNCDGSGDDMDAGTDEGCYRCGGRGRIIPDHCCACGGSPYCTCCSKCGAPNAGYCGCTITVQRADGTTRTLT